MTFNNLGLIEPILKALDKQGYTNPTPIQEQAIPVLLEGKDLIGCAQTGTGKTAAFAIPIIQKLATDPHNSGNNKKIKALVVTPTRELAIQIAENFTSYCEYTNLTNTVIFGGVKQGAQTRELRKGIDILIATPGRLLDLIGQGFVSLKDVKYLVLDEADQMLDMGFVNDIKKILARVPSNRQSLFFSATMPPAIIDFSKSIVGNPYKITINPEQTTAQRVKQELYFVSKGNKPNLLIHILNETNYFSVLAFSRTKHGADKIAAKLKKAGIDTEAIHGNKSQNARQRALENFKSGKTHVLVATDIAARGIDVDDLALVINYDLPNLPETYVHRIGRTGRASASGKAISFCDSEEREYLIDIEKLISKDISVITDHPYAEDFTNVPIPSKKSKSKSKKNSFRPKSNDRKKVFKKRR